jgi:hypothetical protein
MYKVINDINKLNHDTTVKIKNITQFRTKK